MLHCFLYDRILVLQCIVVFYKVALTRESWDRGVMSKGLGFILPIACSATVLGMRNGILILGCCVRESRTMPAIKLEESLLCNCRCFRLSSGTYNLSIWNSSRVCILPFTCTLPFPVPLCCLTLASRPGHGKAFEFASLFSRVETT